MPRLFRSLLVWVAGALALTGQQATSVDRGAPKSPDSVRATNLDSFEYVWKTVRDKHWDPKINGIDWQAVHDELRPKVEAAKDTDAARTVMSDMLERLKQTHFGIFPGDVYHDLDSSDSKDEPGSDE